MNERKEVQLSTFTSDVIISTNQLLSHNQSKSSQFTHCSNHLKFIKLCLSVYIILSYLLNEGNSLFRRQKLINNIARSLKSSAFQFHLRHQHLFKVIKTAEMSRFSQTEKFKISREKGHIIMGAQVHVQYSLGSFQTSISEHFNTKITLQFFTDIPQTYQHISLKGDRHHPQREKIYTCIHV